MLSVSELPRAESEVATPSALLAALPMPRSSSEIVSATAEFLPLVQPLDFGADKKKSGPAPAPASRASQAEPALESAPSPGPPPSVQPSSSLAQQSVSPAMPTRAAVTGCHGQQGASSRCMLMSMQGQPMTADCTSNSVPPNKGDLTKTTSTAPELLNSRPALQRNALLAANATVATTEQTVTGYSMSSYRPSPRFATVPPMVQQKQALSITSPHAPSQLLPLGQAVTAKSHSARVMGNSSDVVVVSRLPSAASAPRLQTLVASPRPAERMVHTSFVGHPTSGCHRSPTSRSCSYSVPQPRAGANLNAPSPPRSPQPRRMAQHSVDPINLSMRAASSPSSAVPAAAGRTSCRAPPMASRVEPSLSPQRSGAGNARFLQNQALQQSGCSMSWCQSSLVPAVSHGAQSCATCLHRPGPAVTTAGQLPRPGLLTGPGGPSARCVIPSASAMTQSLPTFTTLDRSLRKPVLDTQKYLNSLRK